MAVPPDQLAEMLAVASLPPRPASYNIAPTQPVLALRLSPATGEREAVLLRWGLVPAWAKRMDERGALINARSETVAKLPSFRAAYRHRRCLVPAGSFYEWKREGKAKQAYLFQLAHREPFCFAGLWEAWGHDGVAVESCCILTTEANAVVGAVHDRMPVILKPEDQETWLAARNTDALASLLKPYPPEEMQSHPVGPAVNTPRNDDASLVAPLVNSA